MATESRAHGGGVWQTIRKTLPLFGPKVHPNQSSAKLTHPESFKKADVQVNGHPESGGASVTDTTNRPQTPFFNNSPASFKEQHQPSTSSTDQAPQPDAPISFGYAKNKDRRFRIEKEIARGGNGIVFLVTDLHTSKEYAMKSIPKIPTDPTISEKKKLDHTNAIRREIDILRRLRGCLNVASFEEAYEDDTHVHIIMEYCRGGELYHRIGASHYSERTVASFLRAALRTLAQCHANKVLHRDIKPGNFLLSTEDERAPLKAVDFGLAVFYDEKELPRTDLGLEGTPWFMAPETLRSEVYPSSDIWSAGVMAHQLLTGRFPFDDASNSLHPSISKVWKSILTDEVDFKRRHWDGISDEAKDFVRLLLNKDHALRPTAKEALKHPWLQGHVSERHTSGRPLSLAVVQRIQRFSQASLFKRSVLELIAEELLSQQEREREKQEKDGAASVCELTKSARPLIMSPTSSPMEYLYERLRMVDRSLIDRAALAQGLTEMGYKLDPEEVDRLLDQLDPGNTGHVAKSQLAASQMDWAEVQTNHTEAWLRCARHAFADLDTDRDGILSTEDMVALLRHKLPPSEVEEAVQQAMAEAARRREGTSSSSSANGTLAMEGVAVKGASSPFENATTMVNDNHNTNNGTPTPTTATTSMPIPLMSSPSTDPSLRNGLNFRQFVRMLTVGSADSLDIYDDRLGSLGSPEKQLPSGSLLDSLQVSSSFDQVNILLERSVKGNDGYQKIMGNGLDPVPEID